MPVLIEYMIDWMKRQRTDFYIGALTWLSVSIVLMSYWEVDKIRIQGITAYYPLIPIILFSLYFIGFCISNGVYHLPIKRRVKLFGLGISSTSAMGIITIFGVSYASILTIILSSQLPEYFSSRKSLCLALLLPLLGSLIDYFYFDTQYALAGFVLYGMFNIFALYASLKAINEEKAKLESLGLIRELKSTQMLLAATIKRAERVRISQDLHDVVGHHLTALSLQLEVASHIQGDKVKENISRSKSICGLLLSDIREAVSEIRKNDSSDLPETLKTLTQDIPGLKVQLEIDIDECSISDREAEVIFRGVQEAITNCLKHAKASECKVSLSDSLKAVELKYWDNGASEHIVIPGNGLIGLRERVESIGGEVSFCNKKEGFSLRIILRRTGKVDS